MPKKIAETPFRPSATFPTCIGLHVLATITAFSPGQRVAVVEAWEPDGYEVRFIAPVKGLVIGQEIDVPGHAIIAYSGAIGPWSLARIRAS